LTAPGGFEALVFDFDGLILETEHADYESWAKLYRDHGEDLSMELWGNVIGRGHKFFDPFAELERRLNRMLPERERLLTERRAHHLKMIAVLEVLPGVVDRIAEARAMGLKLGVASSSSRGWVTGHLERLGLGGWDCIRTRDDVVEAKPDPELYLSVCACIGVEPARAVALEDSANGIRAARAAGMKCVAIPNPMTSGLDLGEADLRLESLAEISLGVMLERLT
jgi:HAD superfamily hydrolase (TIGR01509 family)